MALQYDEIVRTGLSRQVADLIRAAILEGRLQVDERLPSEDELARRFGISRPTVREALKVLAAQNLIRARRGPTGGNFVTRPDPEAVARSITEAATLLVGVGSFGVDEIVAARIETEAVCCRLAAAHRTDEDLARLAAEIALQRDEALPDEEFCASDVRFHRALVTATGNGPLRLMMHAVIESFIPVTNMLIFREQERRRTVDGHARVAEAIAARDGDRAALLIRAHLEGMCAVLNQALDRRAARRPPDAIKGGETQ
jgi:GntR family transcriptional repressor for pyruvate dehydrogenase complex